MWNIVKEAGRPHDIGPGAPATAERTESGLLSWGGDTDDRTNPFEVRLGRFVDLDVADDVIGIGPLREIARTGPRRQQLGVILEGDQPDPLKFSWERICQGGRELGSMTNCVWSPRMQRNIGYALISVDAAAGDRVEVMRDQAPVPAELVELPFL